MLQVFTIQMKVENFLRIKEDKMTGTQCDNCKKIQTRHEDMSPGSLDDLDFCSKKCLLEFVEKDHPNFPNY